MKISIAKTDQELKKCFPIMVQLRTNLSEKEFLKRVKKQQKEGYQLAYL